MAKTFKSLLKKTTSKKVRAAAKVRARRYLAEMLLSEARKLRGLSQKELADALNIKQPTLSRLEGKNDMQISTLQKIVEALGGRLIVVAQFPEGDANLSQFGEKRNPKKVKEVRLVA